jgi:DNA-binding FadR family transcriptional regulator
MTESLGRRELPHRVRHLSMADQVTDTLRRMILTRELGPGRRITQADLASMLGVSTMPVREALLRLVSEGFVDTVSNRSFTVAATTRPGTTATESSSSGSRSRTATSSWPCGTGAARP